MHKKKNNSVLAGEMILTFQNTGRFKELRQDGEFDVSRSLKRILEDTQSNRVFGEYLFNRIIIEAWNESAIHSLNISKIDFMELLRKSGWHYEEDNHSWVKDKSQHELLFSAPG